jgi:hypothetical protein
MRKMKSLKRDDIIGLEVYHPRNESLMRVQKEIGPEGRRGLRGKLERRTIGPKGTLERRQG